MATKFKAYLIQCITNLHVGSGDANYGIIDKMVQRDPVTNYPTIHSSSLKGGLRQHFEGIWGKNSDKVNAVFGKEDTNDNDSGSHVFLNADLMALPVRCTQKQFALSFDKKLVDFVNTKAKNILNENKIFKLVPVENKDYLHGTGSGECYAEDYRLEFNNYTNPFSFEQDIISNQFATFQTPHFEQLVNNLPVVARNKVGDDKNLWYEEFVPHKTIFISFIGADRDNEDFDKVLTEGLIQIGGNASIGHGLCKFHHINIQDL
ncbi:MAG: type III-B CRISPR module RAMP protein Cmr4 [Bacteroidales bacterium]|jgi:CRISPR-associated protein Cmr4|nr:type III-B CRISPR module RAMP protein Cmr4 [Acholeplasmataceae bacterium]MDD3702422.1 type III-B CRISPR module RAMP protein Cmr4 [Bacteroidales bacterium]